MALVEDTGVGAAAAFATWGPMTVEATIATATVAKPTSRVLILVMVLRSNVELLRFGSTILMLSSAFGFAR
jgi:hypothetical protein